MPNLQQIAYECTICYELFDEIEHRPLTLICENDTCGHTYCLKCIKEITKQAETRKCPTCNASFKYTITNWFVIDLIKTSTYDIDNPYLEVLIDDISKLEISLAEYSRKLLQTSEENEEHSQKMKLKMDLKVKEAHNQVKLVENNLLTDFLRLKNYHEQTLNDCRQFEDEMQAKLTQWHKKLNSIEYRRNSSKLQSIQNEIGVDCAKIGQKRESLSDFVTINEKFSFKEKQFTIGKDLLGVFNEEREPTLRQRLLTSGSRNVFHSLWQIVIGLVYFVVGLSCFVAGLVICVFGQLGFIHESLKSAQKNVSTCRKVYSFKFHQERAEKCRKIVKES